MPNPNIPDFRVHSRGYLPHFEQRGMTYFVTFRLADSLPVSVLKKFKEDLAARMRSIRPKDSALQTEAEPRALKFKQEL